MSSLMSFGRVSYAEREGRGRRTLSIFPGLTLKMVTTSKGADIFAMSGSVGGGSEGWLDLKASYIYSSVLEAREEYFGTARSQLQRNRTCRMGGSISRNPKSALVTQRTMDGPCLQPT